MPVRFADADRVAQAVLLHLDGGAFDAQVLSHQRPQSLHRPTERPREDTAELLCLLVGGRGIDEHAKPPVALAHDLRRVSDRSDRQAADICSLDLTAADMEHQHHLAAVMGGAERQRRRTRAHHVTRARLEVRPCNLPGHRHYLLMTRTRAAILAYLPVARPVSSTRSAS